MADATQIQSLLQSKTPDDVTQGLSLLKVFQGAAADYGKILSRQVIYSLATFTRNTEVVTAFSKAMQAGFSPDSVRALIATGEDSLSSRDSRRAFDEYDNIRLCEALSPLSVATLDPNNTAVPAVNAEDAPFFTAAIGPVLGQSVWRDLSLAGKLDLYYEPSATIGDRLMPVWRYYLRGEQEAALSSFGCQFICAHGASYSLPWISQERFIDPDEIKTSIFPANFSGVDNWRDDDDPLFSSKSLVYSALEGLAERHVVLLNEKKFDEKIKTVFAGEGEAESVRVTVLDKPVDGNYPECCFTELSESKKVWAIDCLLKAAGGDLCREAAALAKHVLCWITRHPALPERQRERLTQLGYAIDEKQPKAESSASMPEIDLDEMADESRQKLLKQIVRAWKKLCKEDLSGDLDAEDFLAAHYARLAVDKEIALTKAGWEFVDDRQSAILDAAEEA